jgi:hypothetical protein
MTSTSMGFAAFRFRADGSMMMSPPAATISPAFGCDDVTLLRRSLASGGDGGQRDDVDLGEVEDQVNLDHRSPQ